MCSGTPFSKPVKGRTSANRAEPSLTMTFNDTVWSPERDIIVVSGFEKTLRSSRESMYVTNNSEYAMEGIGIEVSYLDISGRLLHKAVHDISVNIPAEETRMVDIASFDRQGLYYYHLSPAPKRAVRATPFKVTVNVLYILTPKSENK